MGKTFTDFCSWFFSQQNSLDAERENRRWFDENTRKSTGYNDVILGLPNRRKPNLPRLPVWKQVPLCAYWSVFSMTLCELCCVVPSCVECAWECVSECLFLGAKKSSLFSFSSRAPLTAIVSPSYFYCPAFETTALRGKDLSALFWQM